ncbi:hypothetical protein SERLADRAFT_436148 [Serpula lacrymans var. lacrymans S7.9]|uniref:Serine hydrolase domain-containing protein n=1 Tax=Serpula lacrymans var. lacrymans (strain S7.9) TaxID=578457 RepID=F8NRX0_SERL9|nr:uncharacterized protein SERLADRAFT_436148 [Serpula lacrymans var. lacrymans S7.9]EGO26332.1 hypothetical protein SERLADRAFT_436148 [Serpula lacrymans var. lacrymans S7.9]
MTSSGPRPKVLVLHGQAQNAIYFSKKLKNLRELCKEQYELVFIDGPFKLHPVSTNSEPFPAHGPAQDREFRAWWGVDMASKILTYGLEECLMMLKEVLMGNHFAGVLGFSQGATTALLLAALLEKPSLYPSFSHNGQAPHPPFQFCISISPAIPTHPLIRHVMSLPYSTATLHLSGKTDVVVDNAEPFISWSTNGRVEEHPGGAKYLTKHSIKLLTVSLTDILGHFVPPAVKWQKLLYDYMMEWCSPCAGRRTLYAFYYFVP